MMTTHDRVQAVVTFGFTERQARFLVLVMRHAGVCVPRQYARFAGVAYGAKCNAFFEKLVRRGYAVASECIHNRARLYHVHHKLLYHAVGEVTSRYRRRVPARLAVQRLMLLDAVLTTPDLEWLTTASEKSSHLKSLRQSTAVEPSEETPTEPKSRPASERLGTLPIGLDRDGRAVVLYLATEPLTDDFRSFLQRHAALLRVVPTWTLRLAFPQPLDRAYDAYQTVIREELESPLHAATIGELKWYFEQRREAAERPVHPMTRGLLEKGTELFRAPRFTQMYRRWLKQGNTVFEGPSSHAIAEAMSTGRGRVECVVLQHAYRHLSPLVDQSRFGSSRVEKGVEKEERQGEHTSARPQPPPSTPWSMSGHSVVM
jgi:hypothetical protein